MTWLWVLFGLALGALLGRRLPDPGLLFGRLLLLIVGLPLEGVLAFHFAVWPRVTAGTAAGYWLALHGWPHLALLGLDLLSSRRRLRR